MYRRILTITAITAGVLATGGAGLAVANSVSTTPDAQFISHTDKSGVSSHPDVVRPDRRRVDDQRPVIAPPVTVADKRGPRVGSDDPANHDIADDRGGQRVGSDDPANHDIGDDHGVDNTTPASVSPVT